MPPLKNAWYAACWSHEACSERPHGATILGQPLVLWRDERGTLAAFDDRCVHRLAPLSLGRCENGRLRCSYHGLLYDLAGQIVEIPGQEAPSPTIGLRTYPAVDRHGWTWVWMGEADRADTKLIPPLMGLDRQETETDFHFGSGHIDFAAESRLVCDNLLDLSHLSYLHQQSFSVSDNWATQRPKGSADGRRVRSERWFRRNEGSSLAIPEEDRVDSYFTSDAYAPGAFLLAFRAFPPGSADAHDDASPDLSQLPRTSVSHVITPLSDRVTRDYYVVRMERRKDGAPLDISVAERGFAEDRMIIEAQQRMIDLDPARRFAPTKADKGVLLYNRLIERLARDEQAAAPEAGPMPSLEMAGA